MVGVQPANQITNNAGGGVGEYTCDLFSDIYIVRKNTKFLTPWEASSEHGSRPGEYIERAREIKRQRKINLTIMRMVLLTEKKRK